jgi:Flp pilus assembly protein TadD
MNRCSGLLSGFVWLISHAAHAQPAMQYYQEGSRAFVEQRLEAAIVALKQSLVRDPKQLGAMRLLGLSYQLAGRLDEAELQFETACRLAPNDAESWFYLGRLRYVRNNFDKALTALQTAAKNSPGDARIRECLALTLEATGDWTAAEREYRLAARAGVKQPATLPLNYGALLLKLNRTAESEPLLQRAAAELPSSWQAHIELAKLYCHTDRFEAGLGELKAALASSPTAEERARTHGLMSAAYSRLGRHEEARLAALAAEK